MPSNQQAIYRALSAHARAIAHDFGNPLAGLLLTLELLAQGHAEGQQAARIDRCLQACQRLLCLQRDLSLLGQPAAARSRIVLASLWQASGRAAALPAGRLAPLRAARGAETVVGEPTLLGQALAHFMGWLHRTSPTDCAIGCAAEPSDGGVELAFEAIMPVPSGGEAAGAPQARPRAAECSLELLLGGLIVEQLHGGRVQHEGEGGPQSSLVLWLPPAPTSTGAAP